MIIIQADTRDELLKHVKEMFTSDELDGGQARLVKGHLFPVQTASFDDIYRLREIEVPTAGIKSLWDWFEGLFKITGCT